MSMDEGLKKDIQGFSKAGLQKVNPDEKKQLEEKRKQEIEKVKAAYASRGMI